MGTPSQDLFTHLCKASPVLPAPVLRAAFVSAEHCEDPTLLRTLVAREDAPADLVEKFAALTDPTLTAIYRARNVNPTNTARVPERRAAVLARALNGPNPPAAAVSDALAMFAAKPTKTIADALVDRDPTWFTPAQAASVLLHASPPGKNAARHGRPELAARLGPDFAAIVLANQDTWDQVLSLAEFDVPVATFAPALRRAMATTTRNPYAYSRMTESESYEWLALKAIAESRTPEQRDELTAATLDGTLPPALAVKLADAARYAWRNQRTFKPWSLTPAAPPQEITDLAQATPAHLAALAAAGDRNSLHELVGQMHARPAPLWELAAAVAAALRNPALATADRWAMLDDLLDDRETLNESDDVMALRRVDVVGMFNDCPRTVAAWVAFSPERVLVTHGWEPFGGRGSAPACITRWRAERAAGILDYHRYREVIEAVLERSPSREELLVMDRETLNLAWSLEARTQSGVVADRLATIVAEALGSDTRAWAMYDTLARTFPGPLSELLDTCVTVIA